MRYFIVALVVSLAWFHQDWFIWPFLGELYEQQNYVPAFVNDLSEDEQLAYTAAFARNREHELVMGLPLGVHFQMFLSFATAAVALLAVWKAWPTELERWAEAGNRGNRGDRDRDRDRNHGLRCDSAGGVEFLPHLSLAGNYPTPGGLRAASGSGVCGRLLAVHGGGDDVRDGTHQRRASLCRRHVRRDARDDVAEISRPQ